MNFHRIAAICTFALIASVTSIASAQSAETPAEPPVAKQDCAKRHDHGAERQTPAPHAGCKAAKVAKAKPQAKKNATIQGHDHGKFHKGQ